MRPEKTTGDSKEHEARERENELAVAPRARSRFREVILDYFFFRLFDGSSKREKERKTLFSLAFSLSISLSLHKHSYSDTMPVSTEPAASGGDAGGTVAVVPGQGAKHAGGGRNSDLPKAPTVDSHTAALGIIQPPPDVRAIVDKTAQFVARNGE